MLSESAFHGNQKPAQTKEEWAMDLEQNPEHPFFELPKEHGAHQIVETKNDGELKISACGKEFTRFNHPKGWWGFRPDEGLIHCEASNVK